MPILTDKEIVEESALILPAVTSYYQIQPYAAASKQTVKWDVDFWFRLAQNVVVVIPSGKNQIDIWTLDTHGTPHGPYWGLVDIARTSIDGFYKLMQHQVTFSSMDMVGVLTIHGIADLIVKGLYYPSHPFKNAHLRQWTKTIKHIGVKPVKKLNDNCPECGDHGEWRGLALTCRNGHGIFAG